MIKRTRDIKTNYNIMSPQDMDHIFFSPFQQAIGMDTFGRIQKQLEYYDFYRGRQHYDEYAEQLVDAIDVPRPEGMDYDPTRYVTNYYKSFVDKKANWQMGGDHGISVPVKRVDKPEDIVKNDYIPSDEQKLEKIKSNDYTELLNLLWKENKMRIKLIQAAKDRLIADRAVCKIVFNSKTGKLRWIFRPDTEYVPVYSEDDFEDLIGANFINTRKYQYKGDEIDAIELQKFSLEDGEVYLHEAIYKENTLDLLETITEKQTMGIDFIPVQEFPIHESHTGKVGESSIASISHLNQILNQLNEDSIDSLKFEMFEQTAITNAAPGASEGMRVVPGAVVEIQSSGDTKSADIKRISGSFSWREAYNDKFNRTKADMHELTSLPQIDPQDLDFGGVNSDATQLLFRDIITDTEEHWLSWGYNLSELHEKSIKYLQARSNRDNFGYSKDIVEGIGDNYDNEINFVLPLPDNRKDLVELLDMERVAGFESNEGALRRLGIENIDAKLQEIEEEKVLNRDNSVVSYGESED